MNAAFLTPADLTLLLTCAALTAAALSRRTVALRGWSALGGVALTLHGGVAGQWTMFVAGLLLAAVHGWHAAQRALRDRAQRQSARRAAMRVREALQPAAPRKPMPSLASLRPATVPTHSSATDTMPVARGLAPLVSARAASQT